MLANQRIGTRLALCFGAIVALMLVLSALSYQRLSAVSARMAQEKSIRADILQPLYEIREALAQTGISARNAYIYTDDADAQRELALVEQYKQRYLDGLAKLAPHLKDSPTFRTVQQELMAMAGALKRPAEFRQAGQMEAFGKFLVEDCSPLRRKIVADMDVVVREIEARLEQASTEAEEVAADSLKIVLGLAACAVVLSIVLAVAATRSIVRPLQGAVRFAEAVAKGDLTSPVSSAARDETGDLLRALQNMQGCLGGIVRQVRSGAMTMSTASSEVACGNRDLSVRTEQAAGSLQETAASVEQLTVTVRQTAANARQATSLAENASSIATRGGRAVNDVVGTMDEIQCASQRIAAIVGVIDGIAFQTNILALNAAVEAARAGEQGRGFAVVAAEVRTLAQRSAGAAHEIKNLIQASTDKVALGHSLVHAAGTTMQEVVDSVQRVSSIIGDIATASDGQSNGIDMINGAIAEVDRLTQQNAALVEQAAAASQTMMDEAGALSRQVSVFRIEEGRGADSRSAPAARRHDPMLALA